jgi:uncharacterized membrane protein YphA (DoxX/SURF4 family)
LTPRCACSKHRRVLVVALALRWLLAVVLMVSGAAKLGSAAGLRKAISRYRVVPDAVILPVARLLPAVELCLGLLLATGVLLAPAAIAVACLFVVFAVAIAVNLVRGRHFDCGCGLGAASQISWWHVACNVTAAGLAVAVAVEPAVLALGRYRVSGAPAPRSLVAVPLVVLLACVTSRLLRPLRDTISVLARERRAVPSPRNPSTAS